MSEPNQWETKGADLDKLLMAGKLPRIQALQMRPTASSWLRKMLLPQRQPSG